MLNVYLIHHTSYDNHINGNYSRQIEEIKLINPDKIIIICFEETNINYIFRNLFPVLSQWLIENNKIATLLVSNPDNVEVSPNIITEKSFGFHYQNYHATYKHFSAYNIDYTRSHEHAEKVYTCYNTMMKYHRALTVDMLVKNNLLKHGIVTLHYPENIFIDEIHGIKYKWQYHDGTKLLDESDYDRWNFEKFDASRVMPKSFLKGFIDIITESQYDDTQIIMSEKTAKSVVTLKPFLVVGNKHFHKYLNDEFGIEPYYELFDYSFDSYDNVYDRVIGVIENIKKLVDTVSNKQNRNNIHDILLPKLISNRQNFINYTFDKSKMISKSLEFLIDQDYILHGDLDKFQYLIEFYKQQKWIK